jgi:exosome complex RNA-binding protein Rrp4
VYGYNFQTNTNLYYLSRMCMVTIYRQLTIFILCQGRVWLQSPDHYQSSFRFQDRCGYNRQTIINRYFVSRMCMSTISRPLLIFVLCLGLVWLHCPEHFQSLFCVQDGYGCNRQTIINIYSVSRMCKSTISRTL